ncbi:MAG: EAL domain-containing protein [Gammaproteobacteria bacterium]|jgi:diguanylate cyclase (GGDEF)-like protein/PAS domain S-box-containing protein
MKRLRDMGIRARLTLGSLVTTGLALVVASAAFLAVDIYFVRSDLAEDLTVKADVVAANSRAALTFSDHQYAREALQALSMEPDVVEAVLFDRNGKRFAAFARSGQPSEEATRFARSGPTRLFGNGSLVIVRPVTLDGDVLGHIYVRTDLTSIYHRYYAYLAILCVIILLAGLMAYSLFNRMQRRISAPLVDLSRSIDRVIGERDYGVRVQKAADDEIGGLIDGFNAMLDQIQQRDQRLKLHRRELEEQVAQRTAELREINAELKVEIAERRRTEAEMVKLSSALTQAADAVMVTNREGVIEYVNPAFESVTGFPADSVIGRQPNVLKSDQHDAIFFEQLWETILSGEVFRGVLINRKRDGSDYHEEKTITPLRDDNGEITHFVATGKDITDRIKVQEKLEFLAHHDPVTRLPNRVLLLDRLEQAVIRARRERSGVAVLFLDLDGFKAINDTVGHHAGDRFLTEVARRLQRCVREEDTVARLGGDEFAILLEGAHSHNAIETVTRKVLDDLAAPLILDDRELYATASIGISRFPRDGDDVHTLLRKADTAMYQAKETGKNTFTFYSRVAGSEESQRMELEQQLRRAVEHHQFEMYYQPQLSIHTGMVVGAEALIRWQHPDRGLIEPSRFIYVLEETGLIMEVGDWVVREACQQVRYWMDAGLPPLRVSVNLSSLQFGKRDLVGYIARVIDDTRISPRQLHVEITEGLLASNMESTIEILRKLTALGVSISVDDFGVGYSSLNYLKRFPINTLKIDQSFVRDVTTDPDDAAIIKAIIALAHSMKLDVIAEGVETVEQLEFLAGKGCHEVQGHLFGKPMPASVFEAWFRDNQPIDMRPATGRQPALPTH